DPRRFLYLGWSCMSWRQAAARTTTPTPTAARSRFTLLLHVHDDPRPQLRQKRPRLVVVELRVARLDAEEEAVLRREGEARGVEDRVVRHRQAVQAEHGEDRGEGGEEDRALEGRHDERGNAVVGLAADVQREVDDGAPVAEREAGEAAEDSAAEDEGRQLAVMDVERLGERLDRVRRIGVDPREALLAGLPRRLDEVLRALELGHQAVELRSGHSASSIFASGRIARISKIEIIGSRRMKRKSSARKRPIVPT